jgi:hypothetical protein
MNMPERSDVVEIERLRTFLLPALARRGWTDLSDITNAAFVDRLKLLFEGAMNFNYTSADSPDGEFIVMFVAGSHFGEDGEPLRFTGRAPSKILAFLRAAEEIARDETFQEGLLGR